MREIGEALEQIGLVPVTTIERPEDIVSLAQVLLAGGVQCAEITFRTAAAEESIRRIASLRRSCLYFLVVIGVGVLSIKSIYSFV
jgi:2-keto-3-deoxy-6-phosphogluconate aldolase